MDMYHGSGSADDDTDSRPRNAGGQVHLFYKRAFHVDALLATVVVPFADINKASSGSGSSGPPGKGIPSRWYNLYGASATEADPVVSKEMNAGLREGSTYRCGQRCL